ncbi:structural maintenance of chromosomes protein 5-like [Myxocyprinus asiaticus]|uniref:structural maintenance of chromosomes protein 5-like n=1 Tax=Myxocyprinus asiaticus TaxID=70543 RepID=UPI0022236B71|nr:structural maintenance of chromosomes protein 5-like [Myxocyprinus asiaticus]
MTAKIAPGTWMLLKNKDVPQQIGGVDCGVFMLMYALHLVLGAPFDFTSCDFPNIRIWWALIVLENFGVFSESRESLQEALPSGEQATLSSSEELPVIRHMTEAVKWLHSNRHLLRGPVEEPLLITMDEEDKEKALNNLLEQSEASKEPFTFHFVFRDDMELFLQECHDKIGLRMNCSFEEFLCNYLLYKV